MMTTSAVLALTAEKGIAAIIDNFVVPKLVKLASDVKLDVKELLIPHREHFAEYLTRTYRKLEILNTLAFRNSQMKLKDIYVPLTVVEESGTGKCKEYVMNGFPKQLMDETQKILIVDTAGMGKSTMTKMIFLDIVENGYGIPIFIELRRLSKEKTLIHEIIEQLDSINKEFDKNLLLRFIENGEFIFILDGYDEISFGERLAVTKDIQNFISKTSNGNRFILSSRPESALTSFGDFKAIRIKPLQKKEAYTLIRNYDPEGIVSELLIKQLETGKYKMIDEFLGNPLLVSLLYKAFDFKQSIPPKKHIFYRQVYDAYYDAHDLSKGDSFSHEKRTNLSTDDFNRILRIMGYICIKKSKVEFTKDEILELIDNSKSFCPNLVFYASDMLQDLLTAVPLFVQDGNYYKWAHKSLQEYFAAMFIYVDAKEYQSKILTDMYDSPHRESYYNLLDLYFDIDNDGFRQHVLRRFLNDYLEYRRREWPQEINATISKDLIEQRVFAMYCSELALYRTTVSVPSPEKFHQRTSKIFKLLKVRNKNGLPLEKIYHGFTKNQDVDFIVLNINSIVGLVEILYRHVPELFLSVNIGNIYRQGKVDVLFDEIPKEEIYHIDQLLGKDDVSKYALLNKFGLMQCNVVYANVDEFEKTMGVINSNIQSRSSLNFWDGL